MRIINESVKTENKEKVESKIIKSRIIKDEVRSDLKVVESINTPSPDAPYNPSVVLCTLYGVLSDYSCETRNQRWYPVDLWEKVFEDPLFKEALATKTMIVEADHPIEDRIESHLPYACGVVRDPVIDYDNQCVKGYIDILDTPNGRIVKTFVDYGSTLGVSSRGSGDLTTRDGKTIVDPDTYTFVTWDIVIRPSNKEARVDAVNESLVYDNMRSQINEMIRTNNRATLGMTRELLRSTKVPNQRSLVRLINEGLDTINMKEEVSDGYKSDLDIAYQKINSLKSENKKLTQENDELRTKVSELEDELTFAYDPSNADDNEEMLYDSVKSRKNRFNESTEDEADEDGPDLAKMDMSEARDHLDANKDNLEIDGGELDEAEKELEELFDAYDELEENYNALKESHKAFVDEYVAMRCSQLGINESMAKSVINNRYDLPVNKLSEKINSLYTDWNKTRKLNEGISTEHHASYGTASIVGGEKSYDADLYSIAKNMNK